jgi:Zn-dependent peptidase ImmA (M78 family)
VIVLNGGDFPNGRIFTLLHEVAHLLLRAGGVCDVLPRARPRHAADELEVLCNQIAAAALMPAEAFRGEPEILVGAPDGRWKDSVVASLAGRYSVSREAVVRRLFTLGLADWGYLRSKQAEYRADYDEYRADQRRIRQEEDKPGGPGFYRMKVRDLGRGYIESALDAYHRRAITGSTLTELLEMKVSQIPRLEAELASTGGSRD